MIHTPSYTLGDLFSDSFVLGLRFVELLEKGQSRET